MKEDKKRREKVLFRTKADNICRCGICGSHGTVYREIVESRGILGIREEQYYCISCQCVEHIRILKKDEKIPSQKNEAYLKYLLKRFKNE